MVSFNRVVIAMILCVAAGGGERPSTREERRTEANERKTLKHKLKEKRARQARQAGVAKPRKRRAADAPEPGVYRVVNSAKLQVGAEVTSEQLGVELEVGILVDVVAVAPEPGIARLVEAGHALASGRQLWRAEVRGIEGDGWVTIATPKASSLVRVEGLSQAVRIGAFCAEDHEIVAEEKLFCATGDARDR